MEILRNVYLINCSNYICESINCWIYSFVNSNFIGDDFG